MRLKLKRKGEVYSEDFTTYLPVEKHTPVIIFGPDDYDDFAFFNRKVQKILSKRFKFVQIICAWDQRTTLKNPVLLNGAIRQGSGVACYAEEFMRMPFNKKKFPPYRRMLHIVQVSKKYGEKKRQVMRNKEMFQIAKRVSKEKPFAIIFNDDSYECRKFISMCKKRKIKKVTITL